MCFALLYVLVVFCWYCSSPPLFVFFFKQKTAYEMRISDWSSDVCSSDLLPTPGSPTIVTRCGSRWATARRNVARRRSSSLSRPTNTRQIGRASCRGRGCQYGLISVVAASFKRKKTDNKHTTRSRTATQCVTEK